MGNLLEQEEQEPEHGSVRSDSQVSGSQRRTTGDAAREIDREESEEKESNEGSISLEEADGELSRSSTRTRPQLSGIRYSNGHVSVQSTNPLFEDEEEEEEEEEKEEELSERVIVTSNGPLETLRSRERQEALALEFAAEFSGYTGKVEIQCVAIAVLCASLISAVMILASNMYRLFVLDPLCFLPVSSIGENATRCSNTENVAMGVFLSFVQMLVSLIIPFCGYYGSRYKVVEVLYAFRLASIGFGLYSFGVMVQGLISPVSTATGFSDCSSEEECFEVFLTLEALSGALFLTINIAGSTKLINLIQDLETRTEEAESQAPLANRVRAAGLVAVFDNRVIREEDHVHPSARPVPLIDEEFLKRNSSRKKSGIRSRLPIV